MKAFSKALNYSLVFSLFILTAHLQSQPVTLSLTPVTDKYATGDTSLGFKIRNDAIILLQERFDCIILTRSPGLALLEEQRARLLELVNPELMPYPPAADYIIYPEVVKAGDGLKMRVNSMKLGGSNDSEIQTGSYGFLNKTQLASEGANVLAEAIARQLNLLKRTSVETSFVSKDDEVWAVLPWQDLESSALDFSERSFRLMDVGYDALNKFIGDKQKASREDVIDTASAFASGSTELLAAAVGNRISAEYLLFGTVDSEAGGKVAHVFVVRCIDAAILGSRRIKVDVHDDLDESLKVAIIELVGGLVRTEPLPESPAQLCIREADFFLNAGNSAGKNLYLKANLYAGAYFLAQDTYFELKAIERFYYCISSRWRFRERLSRPDWREAKLPSKVESSNNYILELMRRLAGDQMSSKHALAYAKCLNAAWRWEEASAIMEELIAQGAFNPLQSDKDFADVYLNALSLSGQPQKAEAFYEMIKQFLDGYFHAQLIHEAAANHFRRMQNMEAEFSAYVTKAENNWTFVEGVDRFCELLRLNAEPEERIQLLGLLHKRMLEHSPYVSFILCESYFQIGRKEEAASIAASLLERKDLGRFGFSRPAEARAYLEQIAAVNGSIHDWPRANELQKIPAGYRMYLQPVGELDTDTLINAAKEAGEFFGCDFVVRPSVRAPEDSGVYNDFDYIGFPMLRRLIAARPPPADAIYQVYVVDRRFLVYGRADVGDIYRKNLGAMVSMEMANLFANNNADVTQNLANMLIRQFRYFVERSHGITSQQVTVNVPCVNAAAVSRNEIIRGYCFDCKEIYQDADFQKVFQFTQSLRSPARQDPYAEHVYHPLDLDEKSKIEAYIMQVNKE